ncbi:phosphotransferase [Cellulomonas hominis]|nr:phosphotransferase [Cellulomonas hominis]
MLIDPATSHVVVEDNVVHSVSSECLHVKSGRENLVRHNVFALGGTGLVSLAVPEEHVAATLAHNVLVADGGVTGVVAWGEAKVADPADDLAWLLVAAPQDAVDSIMEAYQLRRTELTDPHLADRALLAGELALARWLLYGVRSGDDDVVADAVQMLDELDEQTRDVAEPGAASV